MTSFIDVLEDKSNLTSWKMRMVLLGVAEDPRFIEGVLDLDYAEKDGKDELNRRAHAATEKAGASRKAEQGTHLHGMSELVDQGLPMPTGLPYEDVADMMAYDLGTTPFFDIRHMERLVVLDDLGVAGTPDRVSTLKGDSIRELLDQGLLTEGLFKIEDDVLFIQAPDESWISEHELIITDLKTGTVEYGALKMAMQLAIYSRAKLYVKDSPERADMENINQRWGIIMHLPAGEAELTLYWADLTLGWEAVLVAQQVRDLRRRGGKALTQLSVRAMV